MKNMLWVLQILPILSFLLLLIIFFILIHLKFFLWLGHGYQPSSNVKGRDVERVDLHNRGREWSRGEIHRLTFNQKTRFKLCTWRCRFKLTTGRFPIVVRPPFEKGSLTWCLSSHLSKTLFGWIVFKEYQYSYCPKESWEFWTDHHYSFFPDGS